MRLVSGIAKSETRDSDPLLLRRLWLQCCSYIRPDFVRSPVDANLTKRRNKRCMSNLEILPLRMLEVVTQQVICRRKQPTLHQLGILVLQADLTFAIFLTCACLSCLVWWESAGGSPADTKPRWRRLKFNHWTLKKWSLQWLDKIRTSLEFLRDSNLMGYLTLTDAAGFCLPLRSNKSPC